MTLQELAEIIATKKQCKDCKFAQKKTSFYWLCTLEDTEIHPLLYTCEHFAPKEEKDEENCCS